MELIKIIENIKNSIITKENTCNEYHHMYNIADEVRLHLAVLHVKEKRILGYNSQEHLIYMKVEKEKYDTFKKKKQYETTETLIETNEKGDCISRVEITEDKIRHIIYKDDKYLIKNYTINYNLISTKEIILDDED